MKQIHECTGCKHFEEFMELGKCNSAEANGVLRNRRGILVGCFDGYENEKPPEPTLKKRIDSDFLSDKDPAMCNSFMRSRRKAVLRDIVDYAHRYKRNGIVYEDDIKKELGIQIEA